MNWTGGRLRRHSEIDSNPRRHTYGLRKLTPTRSRGLQQISLYDSLNRSGRRSAKKHEGEGEAGVNSVQQALRLSLQSCSVTPKHIGPPKQSEALSHVESLKRQLLETSDWGALVAARPLDISFTSTEELERFGKRRKLTKADYRRLNFSAKMESKDAPQNAGGNASSPSMLWDNEHCTKVPAISKASLPGPRRYQGEDSDRIAGRRDTPASPPFILRAGGRGSMEYESQPCDSSLPVPPEILVRPPFTIDNQAIADREGKFIVSAPRLGGLNMQLEHKGGLEDPSWTSSQLSGESKNFLNEFNIVRGAPSTPASWDHKGVPQPCCSMQRRTFGYPFPGIQQNESPSELSRLTRHCNTPSRIFGQPVTFPRKTAVFEPLQKSDSDINMRSDISADELSLSFHRDFRSQMSP